MTYVFVSFRQPYLCPSVGHKHDVSIQSLINLSKTFLWISPARNISLTWIFARLLEYSSLLVSLILDFISWMALMMVWQWKPAINKTRFVKKNVTWLQVTKVRRPMCNWILLYRYWWNTRISPFTKNRTFTARSERIIFIFHMWGYSCRHGNEHD